MLEWAPAAKVVVVVWLAKWSLCKLCPLVSLGCASFSALRFALVVAAVAVVWLAVCLAALAVPLISLVRVGVSTSSCCCVEVVASSWRALVHGGSP